jgi:hypothetical protein
MAIAVAEKVLIAGGVLNLAYRILLGYAITVIRANGRACDPEIPDGGAPRHAAAGRGAARPEMRGPAVRAGPGWDDVAA